VSEELGVDMKYVCECNKVTAAEIAEQVELGDLGVKDYYEVQRLTSAGRTCGSCAPRVIDAILAACLRPNTA